MLVNRRTAIRQFLFVSAGVALLPSCVQHTAKSSIILKHFNVDADQEKLLAALAATIIPTTSTPGAAEVSAHLFALKMLDDCYAPEQQKKFMIGLQQLDDAARAQSGQGFVQSTPAQREAFLSGIETKLKAAGKIAGVGHKVGGGMAMKEDKKKSGDGPAIGDTTMTGDKTTGSDKMADAKTTQAEMSSGDEMLYCYAEMKRLTIQAYTTSSFFLTKVHVYELVPGRWHGCVPVKSELNKAS